MLRFFQYVADRTDIALGMFNSPSSGYVLTAAEMAEIHHRIPAVVAVKEGVMDSTSRAAALHALAPQLVIWECDPDRLPGRVAAGRHRRARRSWAPPATCTRRRTT